MSLQALYDRRSLGIRLGLDTVLDAWAQLGRAAQGVPAVHVVGTNGKGSTAAMVAHALGRAGRRVGLYTSPHLHRVAERVRIDGAPDDDDALEAAVARVLERERTMALPRPLSFFEVLTLAAWLRFDAAGVDVIVAEAGMGGRHDATRLCNAHAVAIASIDLDHAQFLGDTKAAIAAEKVAVARAGRPCFTVPQVPEVMAVLQAHTASIGAPLTVVTPLPHAPRGLIGAHQRDNAALALAAARSVVPTLEPDALDDVVWPGRFERIASGGGTLVLDVAHNPAGIRALRAALVAHAPGARVLLGAMADKDAAGMVAALETTPWTWVDLSAFGSDGARVDGAQALAQPEAVFAWLDAALAAGATVCVCGSHVLVAAVRARALGLAAAEPGERG